MSIEKGVQEPELVRRINRLGQLVEESINGNRLIRNHIEFIMGSEPSECAPEKQRSESPNLLEKMDVIISLLQTLNSEQGGNINRLNKLTGV